MKNSKKKASAGAVDDVLFIRQEQQFVRVRLSDIDFVRSRGNYIEIHASGEEYVIKETLKEIHSRLDAASFFQVHRSYVVNLRKVERIGNQSLSVGETEIPLIRRKKEELLLLLNAI